MLLIGDIHLTAKIKDGLLEKLKGFVETNNEEKNLIFLGDFVYHFSYDRNALLELYDLFLSWYMQGKNIYILAGNHDRLGNMFVFEEGKKAFEMLSKLQKSNDNEICFITKPMVKQIEGKNVCFLPSMLNINESDFAGIDDLKDEKYSEMMKDKNKNINFSAQLNLIVERFLKKYADITLIHHYYIEGVAFPGQQSKFGFKDRALSKERLDHQGLNIISGHIHQAFSYKNYFCTGSIRATSPLEQNQIKYFWKRNGNNIEGYETNINYYFTLEMPTEGIGLFDERKRAIKEKDIIDYWKTVQKNQNKNFLSKMSIELNNSNNLDLKTVNVSIIADKLQYDNMAHFIDPETQQNLQSVQLKKESVSVEKILSDLNNPDLGGKQNFGDRIELLKNLLKKQYPDDYDEYEKLLQEMKII